MFRVEKFIELEVLVEEGEAKFCGAMVFRKKVKQFSELGFFDKNVLLDGQKTGMMIDNKDSIILLRNERNVVCIYKVCVKYKEKFIFGREFQVYEFAGKDGVSAISETHLRTMEKIFIDGMDFWLQLFLLIDHA